MFASLRAPRLASCLLAFALPCLGVAPCSAAPQESGRAAEEALLDELDAALAQRGPFKVTLRYRCEGTGAEGTLVLVYAPRAGRLYYRQEEAEAPAIEALCEVGSTTRWDEGRATREVYDLGPLLPSLRAFLSARAESRGGAALSEEAFRAQVGAQLQVGIEALAMQTEPQLRVGLGVSGRSRSSWIRELRAAPERHLEVELESATLAAERKGGWSYLISRRTGFCTRQRLTLQSATFTLEAEPLLPLESFPDVELPVGIMIEELPLHDFVERVRELVAEPFAGQPFAGLSGAALERLAGQATALAAAASACRLEHLVRSEARAYVRGRRDEGLGLAQLRRAVDAEAARFAATLRELLSGIEAEEERELASLRELALAGLPADSPQARALSTALAPERVRAARPAPAALQSHLRAVLTSLP